MSLNFDPMSLAAISKSLQVLEISGNGISILKPFGTLYNLRKLFCSNNEVSDLEEIEYIVGLSQLQEAVFTDNPCCMKVKNYRDYAIGAASDSLVVLDLIPVLRHQQVAIRGIMAHRRKLMAKKLKQSDMDETGMNE